MFSSIVARSDGGRVVIFQHACFQTQKSRKKSGDYMLKISSFVELMVYFHLIMLVFEGRMFKPEKKELQNDDFPIETRVARYYRCLT